MAALENTKISVSDIYFKSLHNFFIIMSEENYTQVNKYLTNYLERFNVLTRTTDMGF